MFRFVCLGIINIKSEKTAIGNYEQNSCTYLFSLALLVEEHPSHHMELIRERARDVSLEDV